ncbi:MAG: hypothetical protein ACOYL1_06945 [Chlamydiia bacterium]
MLDLLVVGSFVIWCIYKFSITKEMRFVVLAVVLGFIQLMRWPVFLSSDLAFGLMAALGAILMCTEFLWKKKIATIAPYLLIFVGVSGALLFDFFKYSR